EDALSNAEGLRRSSLLLFADREELLSGHAFFLAAHVAAGGEHIVHRPAFRTPAGDGATTKEFGIVRVGDDDQGVAWAVRTVLPLGSGAISLGLLTGARAHCRRL